MESWQQRPSGQKVKRLLLIKEKRRSQVKAFSAFLCIGRWKSLGSLNAYHSFDMHLCHPGDCPVLPHAGSPQGTPPGVAAATASLFYPEFPLGSLLGWL